MSYRYMRIIVMFDLPVGTASERKDYQQFRKYLVKSGFIMMQESSTMADSIIESVKKNKPQSGLVQLLKITEKQYSKMIYIVGESKSDVLSSDERLVIL